MGRWPTSPHGNGSVFKTARNTVVNLARSSLFVTSHILTIVKYRNHGTLMTGSELKKKSIVFIWHGSKEERKRK